MPGFNIVIDEISFGLHLELCWMVAGGSFSFGLQSLSVESTWNE